MRFDCGLSAAQKWRASFEKHTWFAWFPVRTYDNQGCVWLENVVRQRSSRYVDDHKFKYWAIPSEH